MPSMTRYLAAVVLSLSSLAAAQFEDCSYSTLLYHKDIVDAMLSPDVEPIGYLSECAYDASSRDATSFTLYYRIRI